MGEQPCEPPPSNLVPRYRREIDQILEALEHPETFVTDESCRRDVPQHSRERQREVTREARQRLGLPDEEPPAC
jgi:hypothetical protein